jgi:hypothetical protein
MGDNSDNRMVSVVIQDELRREAREINRELFLARANYAELLNSVTILGKRLSELFSKVDDLLDGETKNGKLADSG